MKKVFDFIKDNNLLEQGDNIILGVSGGADSVCLLFVLSKLSKEYGLNITAVHVNHMIRSTAERDEEFTIDLCRKFDVECVTYKTDCIAVSKRDSLSVEEAGRNERYRLFNETGIKKHGKDNYKIAVAHHMDDLAETMIFNMIRGTGINGLSSIKPVKNNIIRPLLAVGRDEIEECLKENGISHVDDETNFSDEYARNKIRHQIIPAMKEITEGAIRHTGECAAKLGEIEDYLTIQTDKAWDKYVYVQASNDDGKNQVSDSSEKTESNVESICVKITDDLKNEHPAISKRVIHRALITVAGRARDISGVQIEAVLDLFDLQSGRKRDLIYNIEAIREYEGIIIRKKEDADTPDKEKILEKLHFEVIDRPISQNIPTSLYTKWFDYDKIKNCPKVRFREEGDYLTVNDENGKKLLSDYFINEKIPAAERDLIPLLADGNHILWVVGHRISNYYKVGPDTKRILAASYIDCSSDEEKAN